MSRDDASLLDMMGALRKVIAWTQGTDKSAFLADERTQSAVQHQLAILGEAVKRISPAFRDEHPEVPWRQIAGRAMCWSTATTPLISICCGRR